MRIGSLFSGYMGLDMAVEEVFGATTAWVSDIDKGACKILAHRAPDVPNLGDITSVDWSAVEPVDIITGGSPCQDLSHAGKRSGMTAGTRSNLWVAMREAIAQLRPRYVVWENVRGAYSAEADSELEFCPGCMGDPGLRGPVLHALGRVLGDLSDLGYDCRWHGLRAADVGAPHGRFRVFVVATDAGRADGERWPGPVSRGADPWGSASASERLASTPPADAADLGHERGGRARDGWPGPANGGLLPTPRATGGTKGGPNQRGSSGDLMLPSAVASLLPTPTSRDWKGGQMPDSTVELTTARGDGGKSDLCSAAMWLGRDVPEDVALLPTPKATNNENRQDLDQYGMNLGQALGITPLALLPTPMAYVRGDDTIWMPERPEQLHMAPNDGGTPWLDSAAAYVAEQSSWGDYAPAIARWEHVLGRPAPAPTMTSSKGSQQLSPRFVEWMQGLPAGWVTDVPGITRNEALKALGNGVVKQQATAALRTMLAWQAVA